MTPYIPLGNYRRFLVVTFFTVASWYLIWRLGSFNRDAMFFSVSLYVAEVYGLFGAALHVFMASRLTRREPKPVIEGKMVDVFSFFLYFSRIYDMLRQVVYIFMSVCLILKKPLINIRGVV